MQNKPSRNEELKECEKMVAEFARRSLGKGI